MDKKHILIIEDDNDINNMLCEKLEKEGYNCTQTFSGTEGVMVFENKGADLILLDLMLPGLTGEKVLDKIKSAKDVPVIILSAKDSVDTKIQLLTTGADDYITKPFNLRELAARVCVQLRTHSRSNESSSILNYGDLALDRSSFIVTVKGCNADLTKQEFKILELFMLNKKRVFSKQEIYDYAWGDFYMGEDKTINVHISNIRKKLKALSDKEYIETVWGIGFRLKELINL